MAAEPESGIAKAVREAGGLGAMARLLGVKRQSVHQWVEDGHAPLRRGLRIAAVLGVPAVALVSCEDARLLAEAEEAWEGARSAV